MPTRLTLAIIVLGAALAGCAGDPDVDGAPARLVSSVTVDRIAWERAPAGCEGVASPGLSIAGCEGEPLLGALVDGRGTVRCVDAISLLRFEARGRDPLSLMPGDPISPMAGDPSPQPNRPPPPDVELR